MDALATLRAEAENMEESILKCPPMQFQSVFLLRNYIFLPIQS